MVKWKKIINCLLTVVLIAVSMVSVFASIDTSNIVPDRLNSHLKKKVASINGTYDTHQWVTDYDEDTQKSFYCYPYALGVDDAAITPGDTNGYMIMNNTLKKHYIDVETVANWTLQDIRKLGASARILTGADNRPDYPTAQNQFLFALRVSSNSLYRNGDPTTYHYHFMRRVNDNCWRYKAGLSLKVIQLEEGFTPETVTWDLLNLKSGGGDYDYIQSKVGIYSSNIIYILVTANSPININNYRFPATKTESVKFKETSIRLGIGANYIIQPVFTPSSATYQDYKFMSNNNKGNVEFNLTNQSVTTLKPGTISIIGLPKVMNSGPSLSGLSFTVTDVQLGDINNDKLVSVIDVTLVQQHLASMVVLTSRQKEAADVNSNGSIALSDVLMMQQYVAKKINVFNVEQKFG